MTQTSSILFLKQKLMNISDDILMESAVDLYDFEDDELDSDYIRSMIEESIEYVFTESRDISWFYVDDQKIVLSGGMSWGESPTDAYDHINKLTQFGILNC